METQNEETLQRLRYLEDTSRYQRKTTTEETVTQAPVFTMPIKDLKVAENQAAHFEARVIPVGDSKLKVEWLRNGVPISACEWHFPFSTITPISCTVKSIYSSLDDGGFLRSQSRDHDARFRIRRSEHEIREP